MTTAPVTLSDIPTTEHDLDTEQPTNVQCRVDLQYRPSDPFAVYATFYDQGGRVTWVFARDLMLHARYRGVAYGLGDVRMWVDLETNRWLVKLVSPDGAMLASWPARQIQQFVDQIYAAVPSDQELARVDVDRDLYESIARTPMPVWLLDIDGVLNPAGTRTRRNATWHRSTWRTHDITDSRGKTYEVAIAQPVIDFINRMYESGLVQIRWHTTWLGDANKLATRFGLPQLPVHDPDMPLIERPWGKLAGACRVVDCGRPLIWTDDDLAHNQDWTAVAAMIRDRRNMLVSPDPLDGLNSAALHEIEQHLVKLRYAGVAR